MYNPIEERKRLVQSRVEKSFQDGLNLNEEIEIEKARHGVYADNAENRRLNRVGQEYGHAAEKKEPTGKSTVGNSEQPTVEDHAGNASDEALKRAAADKNAKPEVREAAQKELEKRGDSSDEKKNDKKSGKKNEYDGILDDEGGINEEHPIGKRYRELMKNAHRTDEERKEFNKLSKKIQNIKEKNVEKLVNEMIDENGDLKDGHPIVERYKYYDQKQDEARNNGSKEEYKEWNSKWLNLHYGIIRDVKNKYDELKSAGESDKDEQKVDSGNSEKDSDSNKNEEFNSGLAIDVINDHEDGLSNGSFKRGVKRDFKEYCNKHGMINVAKELCKKDNWEASDVNERDMPNTEDELKAATTEIFNNMGVKLDAETKKFLKFNEDNVSWI